MTGPSLLTGVGLLLLERWLAVPLEFGFLSLAVPLAFWLSCLWNPAAAALGVGLALVLRRPALAETACDLLPAWLVCLGVSLSPEPLESPLSLSALLLASVPLTLLLRQALAPARRKLADFNSLTFEILSLALLGPLAVKAYQQWPVSLLGIPVLLLALLSSARREITIQRMRSDRGESTTPAAAAGADPGQRIEARAETFQMLEALSLQCRTRQQAVEEVLNLMVQRFPGCNCAYQIGQQVLSRRGTIRPDQGHPLQWKVTSDSTLLVSFRTPPPAAVHESLGVFVRCSAIMLERADFQESLLRSVQALRYLLAATQELSPEIPPEQLKQRAFQIASQIAEDRPLKVSAKGEIQLANGEPLTHYQQEALHLLGQLLQSALQRGQQQAQLSQSSKLAAIGQLAAGVAHELNTPLGSLTVLLSSIQQSLNSRPERAAERLEQAKKALHQMQSIVSKLLYYGRETGQGKRRVDLQTVLQDTLELTAHSRSGKSIAVECQSNPAEVEADPGEIQQVLSNLLINAALALESGPGTIWIVLKQENREAVLQVQDSGQGVDPQIAERIFEPFFTTRAVGQGTGLGLSISRQIAEQHGGRLTFLEGSRFELRLPLWKH